MPYLLVPNEVRSTEALLWVGIINEPELAELSGLRLFLNGMETPIPAAWNTYSTASGLNTIHYQFFNVVTLNSRTNYILELFRNNDLVATGNVRTLPEALPFIGADKPFTILLSSCFSSSKSDSGRIGNTYLGLRDQDKSDIKFLCGDQVYLDDPALHFTFNVHTRNELEDILFANYARTWTQTGFMTGNRQFLQDGANFFTADDHEFWNNAPNRATLIPDTFFEERRDDWREIASNLLQVFQTAKSVTRFDVSPVSFFLADTRVNRGPGTNDFMSAVDLNELENWVNNLTGLGVLVIGQPIFGPKAGFFSSRFVDKNLANYEQYKDLVRILSATTHSIVLLTGDVHYGRIASCHINEDVFLYEIISSPSALVDKAVGGKWVPPPELFPAFDIENVVNRRIKPDFNLMVSGNHFLTLAFFQDGGHTRLSVKAIEMTNSGQAPLPREVADLIF